MNRRGALALAIVLSVAVPAGAGWIDLARATARLDLRTARAEALRLVAGDPTSAEAVAAAAWWLDTMEAIPEPEAILAAPGSQRNPELTFVLARIAARLEHLPPPGALTPAELAGPFGVFSSLDLERDVVPTDDKLPRLGTTWSGPGRPYRLLLRPPDGTATPPEPMALSGVYLAAWTVTAGEPEDGWLVVEADGGFNLAVDGRPVARERDCGRLGAATHWFRLHLDAGAHRIRVTLGGPARAAVRLSVIGADGGIPALTVGPAGRQDGWAGSAVGPAVPPAEAALSKAAAGQPEAARSLLGARLARLRRDPASELHWLERAAASGQEQTLVNLATAEYYLTQPTGAAAEVDFRRCREALRGASDEPLARISHRRGTRSAGGAGDGGVFDPTGAESGSAARRAPGGEKTPPAPVHRALQPRGGEICGLGLLLRRRLDVRQKRQHDAETALDTLVEEHPQDPRVLGLWIREAVDRGWVREAEDALHTLQSLLPGSPGVARLRLAVLGALSRWRERGELLRGLADSDRLAGDLPELLSGACLGDLAVRAIRARQEVFDDPVLDLALLRILLQNGDQEGVRQELARARDRWGDLAELDELEVILAARDGPKPLAAAVEAALARSPSDLGLRTLAWRLGEVPFFEPFRVDAARIAAGQGPGPDGVDSELILDQAVERVYRDGSSIYYYHGLTRALTPAGVERAAALNLLPDSVLLTVRVFKPDGTVVVPPEVTAGAANASLGEVKAGDMVETEYLAAVAPTGTSRRGHMSPYIYRFADADRAFQLSEYVLLIPPTVELAVDGNFTGLTREEKPWHGLRLVRWRAKDVPPIPPEPLAPPASELLPWVSYGFGVTWQDVGDSLRDRVLPVLLGSPELWSWGEETLRGADDRERLSNLVGALTDEVESGNALIQPRATAGQSFSLKRGNRLGILAAVLAHAGWRVDLVMARPRALTGTHLRVPTFDVFGEPLLRVAHDGEPLWLDLREERRGVAHIRPVLQGSDGLLIPLTSPAEPVIVLDRLPEMANPDLEERVRIQGRVDERGADLVYEIVLHGGQGERLLKMSAGVPAERLPLMYSQLAANLFPGAERVSGRLERVAEGVLVHLELRLPGACTRDGAVMTCRSLVLARPLSPALAGLASRTYPLILSVPILQRFDIDLTFPQGWKSDEAPRLLRAEWGSVVEERTETGSGLHSVLRLEIPATTISTERYPEFSRFCHAVDELILRPPRARRAGP